MRYFIVLFFLIVCKCSFAQRISYDDFKREAREKINLQPEYGRVKKAPELIASDNEFINNSVKQHGSRIKASAEMINVGFDYLYKGDLPTAMKRFNQAWLLNNQNEDSYWGFASVYFSFGDYTEALKQLDKGLLLNPNSSNILTDKATIYTGFYAQNQKVGDLNKAIELFNKSYKIDPKNGNTLFKLSVAYFYKGDCVNAKRFLKEHNDAGGKAATKEYAAALAQQCK